MVRLLTIWMLLLGMVTGCGRDQATIDPADSTSKEAVIYTTFFPVTDWARALLGEQVPVVCPLPDDADPIFWEPDRDTLRAYQQASLIISNGAELEKWLQHASLPTSRLVQTAAPFKDQWLHYQQATHAHGGGGAHTHQGVDGHTWLDPVLAKQQMVHLRLALEVEFPQLQADLQRRGLELEQQFDALDQACHELTEHMLSELQGRKLLASHPAYNYLARRYQWPIHNLDLDPAAEFDSAAQQALSEALGDAQAGILLWEELPDSATLRLLEERFAISSVWFSPLESAPSAPADAPQDFFAAMQANLKRLNDAL